VDSKNVEEMSIFATGELAIIREISHIVKDLKARNLGRQRGFPVRTLLCAALALAALHAYADARNRVARLGQAPGSQ